MYILYTVWYNILIEMYVAVNFKGHFKTKILTVNDIVETKFITKATLINNIIKLSHKGNGKQ